MVDDETLKLAVGRILSSRRKSRGWSQEDLAEIVNLHRTYIGSVERGERNLSLINLQKISQALDIPLSELFREVEKWIQQNKD